MDIGIGLPATIPGVSGSFLVDWARHADAGPFSSLSIIDRLVYGNYDTMTTLAVAAGATQRIRLMPSVLLGPLHPPALLAKATASLDALSGGRLTLGLGVGGRPEDFAAAGVPTSMTILGSELFGLFALWLGITFLAGSRRVTGAGPLLRLFAAMALFVELAYSVGYLKARAPLLLAAVLFALTSELASRRRAERILQALLLALPAVSLLGIQLTLLLGRVNLPEDTGLRFAIAAINRRTDLTDFATAIVVNSGGSAYDPAIVPAAVLNAVPRFLFVGAEKVVPDVYSEILGGVGW